MTQPIAQKASGPRLWIFVIAAIAICVCVTVIGAIAFLGSQRTDTAAPTENSAQNNTNATNVSVSTNTPISTNVPISTNAPTPASDLSELPAGFNQQGVPGVSPTFLVPNNWYFTTEQGPGFNSYYVTKEKDAAGSSWAFSTGLTISAIEGQNQKNIGFAKNFIDQLAKNDSTKKVISNSQNEQGNLVSFQLLIEAEYTNVAQDDPNRKKTAFYTGIVDKTTNILYLTTFESPTPIWDAEWKTGQLMINDFVKQLSAETAQPTQTAFNTLANTTLISMNLPDLVRPIGLQDGVKSKLLVTTGGGFLDTAPTPGDPWLARYFLDLKTVGALPPKAVLQVNFESPLDAATTIAVRLYHPSSGTIHIESPLLSKFKCQNYWVAIYVYSDTSQTQELDSYIQWINSPVDLDKVTSMSDLTNGNTCH